MLRQTLSARRRLGALLALVFVLGNPVAAGAQPMDLDTPAVSPLWWTLTDEISPAELRAAFRDPEAHMRRYEEALEAGAISHPLTEEELSLLSFYYNRRTTPELTPLWLAFEEFSGGHLGLRGVRHAERTLSVFGFSQTAIDTILLFAARQRTESLALVEEVGAKSMRFVEIQRRAIRARGGDRRANAIVRRAAEQGVDLLLPHAEVPRSELVELRAAWRRLPVSETAEKLLPGLRQQLEEADWQRFRILLLVHVLPGMGEQSIDLDYDKGGVP